MSFLLGNFPSDIPENTSSNAKTSASQSGASLLLYLAAIQSEGGRQELIVALGGMSIWVPLGS